MSNVQELEMAVSQLSANELLQFTEWFEEFVADQSDKKIEADILRTGWMRPENVLIMNFSLAAECTNAGSCWMASAMLVVLFNQVVTTIVDGQNTSSPVKYIL